MRTDMQNLQGTLHKGTLKTERKRKKKLDQIDLFIFPGVKVFAGS